MPLVPCPDCGRQASTAAVSCPQCGRPNPAEHASQISSSDRPSVPAALGQRTSTPASSELATVAYQPRSAPSTDSSPSDLTKLMAGAGAFFAIVLAIGMCSQSGSVASSASTVTDA